MDTFGNTDPRKMPGHLFHGSIGKDYSSAERADTSKQNYTVCPRYWYIDVSFECQDCKKSFVWLAKEQKLWFEEYGHYVDSQANACRNCRHLRRRRKNLRKEYDQIVGAARDENSQEAKIRVISIVDTLECLGMAVAESMRDSRDLFRKQIYK